MERKISAATLQPPFTGSKAPNVARLIDFVSDHTAAGERFRELIVMDAFTRDGLTIESGKILQSADVVSLLSRVTAEQGTPKRIYHI